MKEDYSDKKTDWKLRKLEKKINETYDEALQEVAEKLADHLDSYEKKREKKSAQVISGQLDELEYTDWLKNEAYKEKHHRRMIDVLTQDTYNTNEIAAQMTKGHMLEVYALNRNYASYLIDKNIGFDTSYALYDKDAVERLIRDNPDLLPKLGVNKKKDIKWNKKKLNNEITQGLLQGESVQKMAKRLERVMGMNRKTAIRNARTATTSAQSGGRMGAYRRAEEIGIGVKKAWMATVDSHTRHSHRQLDGQIRPLDEPFDSEHGPIMEPGDPMADPAEVYNCRCRLRGITKYSDYDPADLSQRFVRFDGKVPTYEEWKAGKNGGEDYAEY